MFDQVEDKSGAKPWGILGGLLAFAAILAAGYYMIT
jgi:hypothetical protein